MRAATTALDETLGARGAPEADDGGAVHDRPTREGKGFGDMLDIPELNNNAAVSTTINN